MIEFYNTKLSEKVGGKGGGDEAALSPPTILLFYWRPFVADSTASLTISLVWFAISSDFHVEMAALSYIKSINAFLSILNYAISHNHVNNLIYKASFFFRTL